MPEVPMEQVVFQFVLSIVIMVDVLNRMFANVNQDLEVQLVQNLVLQESGAKTAETIALASMEHNAIL